MEEIQRKLAEIEVASFVELKFCAEKQVEKTYRGYYKLFRSSKEEWTKADYVRLSDAINVTDDCNVRGVKPIFVAVFDILTVEIVSEVIVKEPPGEDTVKDETKVETPECILPTIVISKRVSLEKMLDALKGVQVIACSLEGDVHRLGRCEWINLVVEDTIVALQIQPLVMEMGEDIKLWRKLETGIFGNNKLVKVIHDCRSAADFLYHQHNIRMENVFDTMIADVYIEKAVHKAMPNRFPSLSECLQRHCPHLASPIETKLLRDHENLPYARTSSCWLTAEPPPPLLKIGAIKIKYLIILRGIFRQKIMFNYTNAVDSHIDSSIRLIN